MKDTQLASIVQGRKAMTRPTQDSPHMVVAKLDGVHTSEFWAEADAIIQRRKELKAGLTDDGEVPV